MPSPVKKSSARRRLGVERLEDRLTPSSTPIFDPITVVGLTGVDLGGAVGLGIGDIYGTGNLDVATANWRTTTVSVLKGSSDGTLSFGTNITLPSNVGTPLFVPVDDFVSGGGAEIAAVAPAPIGKEGNENFINIANQSFVVLYQTDGSGGFGQVGAPFGLSTSYTGDPADTGSTYTTGQYLIPSAVTTGDFGGDSGADLLLLGEFYYQDGEQAFKPIGRGTPFYGGFILVNTGNNTYGVTSFTTETVGTDKKAAPTDVVAADFNNDGLTDFAYATFDPYQVSVSLNSASNPTWYNTFTNYAVAGNSTAKSGPYGVAAGDLNGDGYLDLVTSSSDGFLSVLLNNGVTSPGTFAAEKQYGGFPDFDNNLEKLVVADFTGDGNLDVAVMNQSNSQVYVAPGNGTGTLASPGDGYKPSSDNPSSGNWIVAGELQAGSGKTDVVGGYVDSPDVVVFTNNAPAPTTLAGTTAGAVLTPAAGAAETLDPFPGFAGGIRVAQGDVTGDGVLDFVVAAGVGGGPVVRVYDGFTRELIASFMAYDENFRGGVYVAVGDVDGDGVGDIITGVGAGGAPHVKAFQGGSDFALIRSFFAYGEGFRGGVTVAAGDTDGDGVMDIVTGAASDGAPHVKVFDGLTGAVLQSFFAFAPGFGSGVAVAAGNLFGTGKANVIAGAGLGGGSEVRVFAAGGTDIEAEFMAYEPGYDGGVRVGVGRADGKPVILTGAAANAPHVKAFDPATLLEVESYFAGGESVLGGVWVSPTA